MSRCARAAARAGAGGTMWAGALFTAAAAAAVPRRVAARAGSCRARAPFNQFTAALLADRYFGA